MMKAIEVETDSLVAQSNPTGNMDGGNDEVKGLRKLWDDDDDF